MLGSLVCRVHMVMCTVLAGVGMIMHLPISFMNVRVLVLMNVFVRVLMSMRMRVPDRPMVMLMVMGVAVLVRMDMPVFMIPVHLPSLTPLIRS